MPETTRRRPLRRRARSRACARPRASRPSRVSHRLCSDHSSSACAGARIDKRKHNKRLNAAQVTPRATTDDSGEGMGIGAGGPEFAAYCALRDSMLALRSNGKAAPASHYAEIDARLMLMHPTDMVEEYKRYASLYLDARRRPRTQFRGGQHRVLRRGAARRRAL